jgi:type II secretion system protein G
MRSWNLRGFTLIELLIVVAIIAILAAIAVPNFLEAQTRAKVSRVKADMRSVATGVESYHIDWNKYPPEYEAGATGAAWGGTTTPPFHSRIPSSITTPIAYLTSLPRDPFRQGNTGVAISGFLLNFNERFVWYNFDYYRAGGLVTPGGTFEHATRLAGAWLMYSVGPDKDEWNGAGFVAREVYHDYDATNGTLSVGNIFRTQANGELLGVDPYYYQ